MLQNDNKQTKIKTLIDLAILYINNKNIMKVREINQILVKIKCAKYVNI